MALWGIYLPFKRNIREIIDCRFGNSWSLDRRSAIPLTWIRKLAYKRPIYLEWFVDHGPRSGRMNLAGPFKARIRIVHWHSVASATDEFKRR